jgi:hypothetical protein
MLRAGDCACPIKVTALRKTTAEAMRIIAG